MAVFGYKAPKKKGGQIQSAHPTHPRGIPEPEGFRPPSYKWDLSTSKTKSPGASLMTQSRFVQE